MPGTGLEGVKEKAEEEEGVAKEEEGVVKRCLEEGVTGGGVTEGGL